MKLKVIKPHDSIPINSIIDNAKETFRYYTGSFKGIHVRIKKEYCIKL